VSRLTRREFLGGACAIMVASTLPTSTSAMVTAKETAQTQRQKSPFRLAVITDEISQDFDHACSIAAREFGLEWIELRGLWNKNVMALTSAEIDEARRILERYGLGVTDIGSPLFKVDWPDAAKSKFSPKRDQFSADFSYDQQGEVLEKCIALAKAFRTNRVRGFDFWRLDDQTPHRDAINAKLQAAANTLSKQGLIFVLENEFACNTATGAEAAKTLAGVPSPHFMLNWDPGNAVARGEVPYPDGFRLLPKHRIGHCHCKDAIPTKSGEGFEWAAVGKGSVDWIGQFRALKEAGYRQAISLETHWRGAGSPEESSRQSWAGMKAALQKAGALG
jgi:L-ribulose-5-phosphate 3-epimerase